MKRPWQEIPTWLPIVLTVASVLCSAGATYATFGGRLDGVERRMGTVEEAQARDQRAYATFREDVRSDLAVVKTDVRWIRSEVSRRR